MKRAAAKSSGLRHPEMADGSDTKIGRRGFIQFSWIATLIGAGLFPAWSNCWEHRVEIPYAGISSCVRSGASLS